MGRNGHPEVLGDFFGRRASSLTISERTASCYMLLATPIGHICVYTCGVSEAPRAAGRGAASA